MIFIMKTLKILFNVTRSERSFTSRVFYCKAQGPTLGPTQGRVKVKVRTCSGHGQVRSNSNSNLKAIH